MRSVAVAVMALALASCGQAGPGDKFVGHWTGNGGAFSIEENGDSYLLINDNPNNNGFLMGVNTVPLTVAGDQLSTNTYVGNMSLSDENTMHFGGLTWHRQEE